MTAPAPIPTALSRLRGTAADFARLSLALVPLLMLARLYEIVAVRASHPLPAGSGALLLRGWLADLALAGWMAAVLALPLLALAQAAPRLAVAVHRGLVTLAVVATVGLAEYFAVTFVPLGSDLWGYSPAELRETALTSGGGSMATLLPLLLFAAGSWWATGAALRRLPLPGRAAYLALALLLAAAALRGVLAPGPQRFASDPAYFLASNKLLHLSDEAGRAWAGRADDREAERLTGYPLLRAADAPDVLGPLLRLGDTPPNVVLVLVEGLGRDFTGPGARFGGFTPFLDSLATRGLYWENFLSITGRTFGVLPAVLGSLPFGETGFNDLGSAMPEHLSIVRLLGERGYATNYFNGFNGQFDRVDLFMERQRVDRFVDQSRYGPEYTPAPGDAGGFSWGYADRDLFRRSLEILGSGGDRPRLDVYQTTSSHEPFVPPAPEWRERFRRRLAELPLSAARRREYAAYEEVFATLLYVDDALRYFFEEYQRRPEYANTLFLVTGDHRLIPVPEESRIARYHVPLLIHSPLVRAPRRMASVSSHLDLAPTLTAMLAARYGMRFPDRVHWLGEGVDTAVAFRNVHSLPLMRTKGALDEYIRGDLFLSRDQLFRIGPGLELRPVASASAREEMQAELRRFRRINRYVVANDRLYPAGAVAEAERRAAAAEDSAFAALGVLGLDSDQLFARAREWAQQGRYEDARVVTRRMLRDNPSLHDVRTLMGRSYAWEGRTEEARPVLREVVRRAPEYPDAHAALADLELWAGRNEAALVRADSGLSLSPDAPELRVRRAVALERLGRREEARATLRGVAGPEAAEVRARLGG